MHLLNRLHKSTNRYKELLGKDFEKISENKLQLVQVIEELENSIQELDKEKPRNNLQISKLQSMLIKNKRNLAQIKNF